jgi:hypothetical protein
MKIGTMVVLLSTVGFCLIGFVSTFWQEDETKRFVMRAMYGSVGLVCLATTIWASRPEKPPDSPK